MKVILASKNQHKLTELSAILSGLGFEIALESEYGLDIDVDEMHSLRCSRCIMEIPDQIRRQAFWNTSMWMIKGISCMDGVNFT